MQLSMGHRVISLRDDRFNLQRLGSKEKLEGDVVSRMSVIS